MGDEEEEETRKLTDTRTQTHGGRWRKSFDKEAKKVDDVGLEKIGTT